MRAAAKTFLDSTSDPTCRLIETSFDRLDGFSNDDLAASWRTFRQSALAVARREPPLRAAVDVPDWTNFCRRLAGAEEPHTTAAAERLIRHHFTPYRIEPKGRDERGFLTGYYEPVVDGSRVRTATFTAPILARPDHYDRLGPGVADDPYPERAEMEAAAERGEGRPIVWLRDWTEVFFVHIQGSARVALPDSSGLRLVYDGRNGQPYTSIGGILVEEHGLRPEDVSLEPLKRWIRDRGQAPGEPGRALMQRNRSYIFFRAEPVTDDRGPIGGEGLRLEALRSIAIDRTIWPYGLPFWIEAELPWRSPAASSFRQLMVAQDTGSAIVGPARFDLFFGSGNEAGRRAGEIRHRADVTVLLPRDGVE